MTDLQADPEAPDSGATPLRIVIADDHKAIRYGLRIAFEEAGVQVVAEAGDGEELIEAVLALEPDVVLTDVSMPRCGGIEATRRIREVRPRARIVMLTMHDDAESIRAALLAGACGFLSKDCSFTEVLDTVRKVAVGDTVLSANVAREMLQYLANTDETRPEMLSPRQREVLECVAKGMNPAQIGRTFGLSPKTVNNHLAAIYRRLDAQNLTQAMLRAVRLGIIKLD